MPDPSSWLPGTLSVTIAVVTVSILLWRFRIELERRRGEVRTREFTSVSTYLSTHRAELSADALHLYRSAPQIAGVPLLVEPGSVPPKPLPTPMVQFMFEERTGDFYGLRRELAAMWPPRPDGGKLTGYSDAIAVKPPATFYNGPTYRLLGVEAGESGPVVLVAAEHYFDYLDTCEALAYELARAAVNRKSKAALTPKDRSRARRLAGQPFAFDGRCTSIGVSTLTLVRRGPTTEFWMHQREASGVATAQGTWHVIPAGEFQPTSISPLPADRRADLDFWRTMAREFVEEFLNLEDLRSERGRPLDFATQEPLAKLEDGRRRDEVVPYFLGLGVDPLNLKAEVMTALVIDGALFDRIVGRPPDRNLEGRIVGPQEFTAVNVDRYLAEPRILPAGAGAVRLGWAGREVMLGRA